MKSIYAGLTVRQALELEPLAGAQVAAGETGLDNRIQWVHIVDMAEARYEWGKPGVLLLTTGYGWPADEAGQIRLIAKLVEEDFAGMLVSLVEHMPRVPAAILRAADEHGFPVIEVPPDVLFVNVTEAIFQQIISRQYRLLQQSARIHQKLTSLVLQGGDLKALAATLAELLQRSVTIEDTSLRVLATAQQGAVDEARQRSVDRGRASDEVAQVLLQQGIYRRLSEHMAPVHVPAIPEMGMTMERIVAPIVVAREIHGYIWIIAGERALTDLDQLAITHGATVTALVLLKEQAVRDTEERLRGDFFEMLLDGTEDTAVLAEQAHRLHYRLDQPHQVVLVHGVPRTGGRTRASLIAVERWLRSRGDDVLAVWRDEGLVLLVESRDASPGERLAKELVAEFSRPVCPLLAGVGEPATIKGESPQDIGCSYRQAQDAVHIQGALGIEDGTATFRDLGYLYWLYSLPADKLMDNLYLRKVKALAAYDAKNGRQLVKTLESYLDHGTSLVEAAEALFIHRNTLLHRLERIEAVCSLSLREPMVRFNLHLAVKCYRLRRT